MKIIIAPDKFKNSLTGLQFCQAVEAGIKSIKPNVDIVKLPLADGGDGTMEVVDFYLKGKIVKVKVNNPFFLPITASYLYSESSKTAYIEMAEASGLKLLKEEEFDCKNTTTFGTGEMITDAINKGVTKVILGIGGSATNDCGTGMATALGYRFLDENNKEVNPIGTNLSKISTIDFKNVNPKLKKVDFEIACDVINPLYGKTGAAYIYGAQKGATEADVKMLDKGLENFSKIIETIFNVNPQLIKGAGAAGGMGIASKIFLKGQLESGIQLIKKIADFDSKIENADWIITGEGKLDSQTLSGKTITGVITSAKAKHIKVAVLCGANDLDKNSHGKFEIDYVDAVINHSENLNDAMENGYDYVKKMATIFAETLT